MLKSHLRDIGFAERELIPKPHTISILWGLLSVVVAAITVVSVIGIMVAWSVGGDNAVDPFEPLTLTLNFAFFEIGAIIIYFFVCLLVPLILKCLLTILLCQDRHRSIKLKILKGKGMPICECKEALMVWQIVLIYFVPFSITYAGLLILSALSGGIGVYGLIMFLMLLYWCFDLTLIVYTLCLKIRYGMDYIAIDHHVYALSLYNKSHIRAKKT